MLSEMRSALVEINWMLRAISSVALCCSVMAAAISLVDSWMWVIVSPMDRTDSTVPEIES